jgi:hypothetical protein
VVGCVPFTILNMSLLGSVGIKPTGEEIWWFKAYNLNVDIGVLFSLMFFHHFCSFAWNYDRTPQQSFIINECWGMTRLYVVRLFFFSFRSPPTLRRLEFRIPHS